MTRPLLCLLVLAGVVGAQSTARLNSDLTGLGTPNAPLAAVATRVADDIMALADKDAQPSRQAALDFSIELSKALAGVGKASSQPKLQEMTAAILDVLQSSGIPSYRFHGAVDNFRNALLALDATPAQAKNAANRLMILGQEVRGPDDIGGK